MNIRLLYDVFGWAYYQRCKALQANCPPEHFVSIGPDYGAEFKKRKYDVVLQLCYDCAGKVREHITKGGYNIKLVTGLNVAWEAASRYLPKVRQASDYVLFNSRLAFQKSKDDSGKVGYISNGVDLETFRVKVPIEKRKPRVLWCGSKFHRRNKGHDMLKILSAQSNIPFDLKLTNSHAGRSLLTPDQMADWYNTGTVYVVASQFEGTPNPALEAAACGCVVVSTSVGNMPELIESGNNGYLVNRDPSAIKRAIELAQSDYPRMARCMQERIQPWGWSVRARQYFDLFESLVS